MILPFFALTREIDRGDLAWDGSGMMKILRVGAFAILLFSVFSSVALSQNKARKLDNEADAKHRLTGKERPPEDPDLAAYGIYAESAPMPEKGEPVETTLPLSLQKGVRIALVGNTLLDRGGSFGFLESMIYQAHPEVAPIIRNFSWSADEIDLQPRPDNFATVPQHLTREKIDVVVAAFGFNESFAGVEGIQEFKKDLGTYLREMKTSLFNGESGPEIVLLSPTASENIDGVPASDLNNTRIEKYVEAMRSVAEVEGVGFVDVFHSTIGPLSNPDTDLTINGVHLTEEGYRIFAEEAFRGIFGESAPEVNEALRETVVDKNRQFFRRYRPVNSFYYTGGRKKDYGYLDFLPAMRNFDIMTSNREKRIHALARGEEVSGPVDDSNLPEMDQVVEARGANEWMSPAQELEAFDIDPRFEVNAFATEEEFPDIACPIAMRWDSRGRLWVSCSTTYPHVYPGDEPRDKMVILEDVDGDGRADKSTVFADDLHIPLSFVLTENGVYVSDQPDMVLLEDTDGDDKADRKIRLLTGFGTEDSHHSLHDFVWTPDGDLLFRESIFHHSQVETPYGPVRAENSAWFRFTPSNQKLISFGSYPNTNPWGVTFDHWGYHVASHPIFASAFHSLNPPYPQQQPKAAGIPAYSGVCGHEFVDFPMWPEEMQGGFVKVRYKPTNRVEFHRWIRNEDHYAEEYQFDLIFSKNLSFIPVDLRYGPRGAMYVCDWYNPVKGHAQYSLRDPRRDRASGRIWRIVPKGAKLQDPPEIENAPLSGLLENLKRKEYRYRYWSKRELAERPVSEVVASLDDWMASLDPSEEGFEHHLLEAVWTYRRVGEARPDLLTRLLDSENPDTRAAATTQLRYWGSELDDGGISALNKSASDDDGIVRMEAIIAATYFGTEEALEAVAPAFEKPMGDHLKFAAQCALISEPLRPFWDGQEEFLSKFPAIDRFSKSWTKHERMASMVSKRSAQEASFDSQEGLKTVEISCIPERLMYDRTKFAVRAGQPVRLILKNPDATQHNLVIVEPGAAEEVGMAGNEMAKDPKGLSKGFIPMTNKILHHTGLLEPDTAEVLRFIAPQEPGTYPYLCTFPGHWIIMKGEMIVRAAE